MLFTAKFPFDGPNCERYFGWSLIAFAPSRCWLKCVSTSCLLWIAHSASPADCRFAYCLCQVLSIDSSRLAQCHATFMSQHWAKLFSSALYRRKDCSSPHVDQSLFCYTCHWPGSVSHKAMAPIEMPVLSNTVSHLKLNFGMEMGQMSLPQNIILGRCTGKPPAMHCLGRFMPCVGRPIL